MGTFANLMLENADEKKRLAYAHAMAQHTSEKEGVVQHVNKHKETGKHYVSDWYDHEETVASYSKGKLRESTEVNDIRERSEYAANQHLAAAAGKAHEPAKVGDTIHYTNDAGHKQKETVARDLGNKRYGVITKDGSKFSVHHNQIHQIDRS
jgi:hypothetical protein